jgi:hypothetical protein
VRRAARKEATSIGTGCKFYERTCPVLPYIYIYRNQFSVLIVRTGLRMGWAFKNRATLVITLVPVS